MAWWSQDLTIARGHRSEAPSLQMERGLPPTVLKDAYYAYFTFESCLDIHMLTRKVHKSVRPGRGCSTRAD